MKLQCSHRGRHAGILQTVVGTSPLSIHPHHPVQGLHGLVHVSGLPCVMQVPAAQWCVMNQLVEENVVGDDISG